MKKKISDVEVVESIDTELYANVRSIIARDGPRLKRLEGMV